MAYDVAVIGLGAMGSAAVYHLARRGLRVLGVDRFSPPHDKGSSHGKSRAIRKAYFEHPSYVPLVLRAYELWRELEAETGARLLNPTEMLLVGKEDSTVVRGSIESARTHGLKHTVLSTAQVRSAYPALNVRPGEIAVREDEAGVLFPEDAVAAHLDRARQLGAELRFGEVADPLAAPLAPKTVLATGPWMKALLPELPLAVERQLMFWFDPVSDPGRIPLFLWDFDGRAFYVIPDLRGDGFKVSFHHRGPHADPHRPQAPATDDEIGPVREQLARAVPSLNGALRRSATCFYTVTPDEHFVVGFHPKRPDVTLLSPCSGHGFKFSAVIGEIAADLATEGRTRHPIDLFRPDRFES